MSDPNPFDLWESPPDDCRPAFADLPPVGTQPAELQIAGPEILSIGMRTEWTWPIEMTSVDGTIVPFPPGPGSLMGAKMVVDLALVRGADRVTLGPGFRQIRGGAPDDPCFRRFSDYVARLLAQLQ